MTEKKEPLETELIKTIATTSNAADLTTLWLHEEFANSFCAGFLESMTDGFWVLDREWRCIYINNRQSELFGISQGEIIGKNFWEFLPDALESILYPQLNQAITQQIAVTFAYYQQKSQRWLEHRAYPGKEAVYIFTFDITEQQIALNEQAQCTSDRQREERRKAAQYAVTSVLAEATTLVDAVPAILQSLCESLGWQLGVIWKIDSYQNVLRHVNSWQSPTSDLQAFIDENQQTTFAPGFGLPGRIWANHQPAWISKISEDSDFTRAGTAIKSGLKTVFGFPILLGDEMLGVIECFSDRIQEPDEDLLQMMATIGSQIGQFIERKRTEAALRESQELFQSFMQHSPITGFIKDENGRYLYVNPKVEQLFNCTQADLLGKTDFELFPFNAAQQIHNHDLEVWNRNQLIQYLETVPLEDREYSFMTFKFPFQDAAGHKLLAGMSIDISDRIKAEAEREQLLKQEQAARETAEAANRIKDEFLAVLSHELRTPLNPILGWTQLLLSQKLDAKATERALVTIERNAKLQTQLIGDLLDISRILRGKISLNVATVNLITTVEAALETVHLAAEAKNIRIQTEFNPDVGQVSGDAGRIQQVVWNLLSNAVKFTPEGGQVEIRLEQVGKHAQIQVKDTGKGISAEFLPFVFDYFRQEDSTTTRKFGGLGLGLAIARHITELHGGTVKVKSPGEGLGATFTIKLPVIANDLAHSPDNQALLQNLNLNHLKILAVDDDADMRELIVAILKMHGAEVRITASAAEALILLAEYQPDVLISDIGMPDMNGYMLMRQIKTQLPEKYRQIPAIALTAYAAEYDQNQALAAGFQLHLAKPVDPEELVRAIALVANS